MLHLFSKNFCGPNDVSENLKKQLEYITAKLESRTETQMRLWNIL